MNTKKTVEFDYEAFLGGNSRTRNYIEVLSIVESHINEARYRVEYRDFNGARETLDYAGIRIRIFREDLTEAGIELDGKVSYLCSLVENVRKEIFGDLEEAVA